jgi:NAD(P)-dependent dehydrogenase (short-subunit alcohol dehydrogenase family)
MDKLFDIQGKVALVTGGGRGIGLMIARGYCERGAKVYISSRKADVCSAAAEDLSKVGECVALPADLAKSEEIERVVSDITQRESKLDILVNNAGATWGGEIDDFPEVGWDKVMDLNVKSVFFLTQKLLPLLTASASASDPARVINIGSIDGMHTSKFTNYSYSPSKAAVHHLTRMLATNLASRHILVNAIAPGPFATDMMAPMMDSLGEQVISAVPLKRMGGADDAVGMAVFLASMASSYVNGAVIPLDGGCVAAS